MVLNSAHNNYTWLMLSLEAQSAFFNKESVQKVVKATVSQKTTLSCEVTDTKAEVKWYKDGKLLTSSKTIHAESKGRSRQLVIDSVERKDAGEYTCEAGNEKLAFNIHVAGKREGGFSQRLYYLLSVINSCWMDSIRYVLCVTPLSEAQSTFFNKESVHKEVKTTLSQKTTLSCEVSDSKTEVKWYKNDKLLTSTKTIHAESVGKSRQLVIESVEQKDAGEYTCEAGTEKLVFKLQVAGRGKAWSGL